jgi:polyhydroxyalkanoate synthesis regulator phasin
MTMTAKKKKVEGWRALPQRITELQATVEKRVRKGIDEVTEMLPVEPRKAVKRLTADAERMRHDLRKRAEMLRKRGDKMVADTRKRTERFTAEVQKRMEGAITPLTKSLDLASRTEVEKLRKRLEHLERRVEVRAEHGATA